ncbi:pyridoxal phosphate-dependent transferase [Schizophyllum fasciatum]
MVLNIEEFRKAGYAAIDHICDYFYSLEEQPVVAAVEPGYLAKLIPASPPQAGEPFQDIAADYKRCVLPGLTHWSHPSFFAFFPTACTFEGILADLYSSAVSNPGFNWICSPACTELEVIVMDWAAQLFGLDAAFFNSSKSGGGCLQTTASDSALTAAVAARNTYMDSHPDARHEGLVILCTTQTHSLALKAGRVLGIAVRTIDVNAKHAYGLRGEALAQAIAEEQAKGRQPFFLIATIGTTSSGAIDNIAEIRNVVSAHPDIWLHVDAAWAGVALSLPEMHEQLFLSDINKAANSLCINFHKWGLVNFDCSTLWVRNRVTLTQALDVTPLYLRTKEAEAGTVTDFRNWHLALGRRFRSLKLWFVLRSYGVEGFQAHIRKGIYLNTIFVDLIKGSSRLVLAAPPSLGLTVFRMVPAGWQQEAEHVKIDQLAVSQTADEAVVSAAADVSVDKTPNALTQALWDRLDRRRGELFLSQTALNGVHCVRFAVGAARTQELHVRRAFAIIEEEAAAVAAERGA